MKKLTVVLAALLCSFQSFSQQHYLHNHKTESRVIARHLMQPQGQLSNVAAKTTSTKQRLIARSEHDGGTGSIMDSFSVVYSGSRGSTFDRELMDFGQWVGPGFPAFGDVLFGYSGNGQPVNKNMGPYVLGDTFRIYSIYPVSPYTFNHFADQYHTYDASNNLLDENWLADAGMGGGGERYVMRYNTLSNITRASYLMNSSGSYDTIETAFFLYNSSNQLIVDSICGYNSSTNTYSPQTRYDYSYDGTGNMILGRSWGWSGSAWLPNRSYTMTYYAGTHQLKTLAVDTMFTGGLPETLDSFGYTPGVSFSTHSRHVDYTLAGPQVSVANRHVNTAGLPDSIDSRDFGMGSHDLAVFTYNSYNNPVRLDAYDSNMVSPTHLYSTTYYYYQLYDATSIANTNVRPPLQLYPNPVRDRFSLSCQGFATGDPVYITITDFLGKKLQSETVRWEQDIQVSVSELLPGAYIVQLGNGNGVLYTRQMLKL